MHEDEAVPLSEIEQGTLLHYIGTLINNQPPEDFELGVTPGKDTLKLRRTVEMFQNVETEHNEQHKDKNGDTHTTTTYSYEQRWSGTAQTVKHDEARRNPSFPSGLQGGTVILGDKNLQFKKHELLLSPELVSQVEDWKPLKLSKKTLASDQLPFNLTVKSSCLTSQTGYFSPKIGDIRVTYDVVLSDIYTSVAKLDDNSLVPMRGRLKASLASQGPIAMPQDSEEIIGVPGSFIIPEAIISRMENLLLRLAPLQVAYIGLGNKSVKAAFQSIKLKEENTRWGMRVAGTFIIYLGMWSVTGPLAFETAGIVGPLIPAVMLAYSTIEKAEVQTGQRKEATKKGDIAL